MRSISERMSASHDQDFVVFLIGMRFRWRRVQEWRPLLSAMNGMVHELNRDPDSGYMGGESWIGNPTIMVQYWRSFEDLHRYAHDPDRQHRPAWLAFHESLTTGADLGIWHEAFQVRAGDHSTIYNRMPPFGLARATQVSRARRAFRRSGDRTRAPERS